MSELVDARLFEPSLSGEFAWVLEALFEIDELTRGPSLTKPERRARGVELYARLCGELGRLHEPTPAEHAQDAPAFRRWFGEAVLLWVRFGRTGSAPLVDSVGAQTLREFPVDLPPDEQAAARVKMALGRAFAWSQSELDALERRVEHLTSNLELKRRIAQVVADELRTSGRPSAEARVDLMREFYGPLPFRAGEVDVLVAATAVFFFVPRKGNALDVAGYTERPDEEQRAVRAFFERLDRANNAETRRFPSFGLGGPETLGAELVARLARALGVAEPVVRRTLATMFSFIPKSLHAQYLVHDLWGHTWQEALNEFESEYARLPELARPLSPADGPEFGGPGAPTLGSAFVARGGRTELDEARLLAFGEADLRGRIQIAVSVPLSEVLADFMESKFSRACPELALPTSSLIPSTQLKIDLTIADTRTQVRRYREPYRKLAVHAEEQARLAAELEALGLPRPGLAEAVARAGRLLWLGFVPAFDDTLAPEPAASDPGRLRSSVLRRLMIQFALVMADFEGALGKQPPEAVRGERWRDPASSPDLFAVAFTHFYEQDRRRHFWHIDQVARNEFTAACERIRQALDG